MVIYGNSYLHEKSPENTVFPGLFESDADGTRTRNHRIDSLSTDSNSTREKPDNDRASESWLSRRLSEDCDSELQNWLDSCPFRLSKEQKREIITWLITSL